MPKKKTTVYIAQDVTDDKLDGTMYVGSTNDIDRRRQEHTVYPVGRRSVREVVGTFPSSEDTRFKDERELMSFCRAMGIPLSNRQTWGEK